ncbi:MAG: hypothetical protein GX078_03085 [Clostridiales bacterium]|nr:hypothetical protein [Clostridiales bacterium]
MDIFSFSSSEVIASSSEWALHSPDNENRCQYLTYDGTKVPKRVILYGTILES